MSWGVSIVGPAANVSAELDAFEATLTGASLDEFKEAKPALQSLLGLIVNQFAHNLTLLTANGHATFVDGKKTNGYVTVELKQLYAQLAGG